MMMKYKLSRLNIKNYKCLASFLFDFQENNLIVFDGPNGYGKTTCFEALEILFTKKPRKINKVNLDGRYTYENSPIHYQDDKEIEISVQIISDSEQINIKRIFPPADKKKSKKNNINVIFDSSKLFINDVEVSEDKLEKILDYENLNQLFNVLNYVEQDENTYFLKEDPKSRYKALVSLLGGDEERKLLDKTNDFSIKLQEKISIYNKSIDEIKSSNKDLFENPISQLEYNKLVEGINDCAWDNEIIRNTEISIHNSYLNEIKKIQDLFAYRHIIADLILLRRINYFRYNDSFLTAFIQYYWSIENFNLLKEENTTRINYLATINNNSNIIKHIDSCNYDYLSNDMVINPLSLKKNISFQIDSYKIAITTLLISRENLSIQNKVLAELKEKRESLIKFSNQHVSSINIKGSECPTCGYDWQNVEHLASNIEETEIKIFKQYKENNILFESQKAKLQNDYLNPLKALLIEENEKLNTNIPQLISSAEFSILSEQYNSLKTNIDNFLSLFKEEVKKTLLSYVNHKISDEQRISLKETISSLIDKEKPNVDIEVDTDTILSDFKRYFNEEIKGLNKLTSESIHSKKSYIEWQYYNSINNKIQEYSVRLRKIEKLKTKIDKLKNILDAEIKNYTKSIIDNISIPFYIYTGKILQNHSLGSGLIIDFEIDRSDSQIYIRPSHRDQEVTYTLSSGQLSATVISLMLVLNKVFNHSKLGTVLIDDPLQTLDEINLHSLVELLKYNFSDQQLFISTHEDRYSRFIRYKYDKFGLRGKNINMKDEISYK